MSVEQAKLLRTFTITYDLLEEVVNYDNPDSMTYIEILGLIKYCEMRLALDMMKNNE
jgi:hypothetical protein